MAGISLTKVGSTFNHTNLVDMPDGDGTNADHDKRYAPAVVEANCTITEQIGNPVYVLSASEVRQADASSFPTARVFGFISEKPTTTTCRVQVTGGVTLTGLTPGAVYFLSETTGEITTTPPTSPGSVLVFVGQALSSTELIMDISATPTIRS